MLLRFKKKVVRFFALFFIQIMNRGDFRSLHTLTLWESSDLNPDKSVPEMHYRLSCSASQDTATPGQQVARTEAEGVKYLCADPPNCFEI